MGAIKNFLRGLGLTVACLLVLANGAVLHAEGLWPFGGGSSGEREATPKGETLYATTPDGWKIAVEHFAPAPGSTPHAYPVILCHGFGYNNNFWMLDSNAHLPSALSSQGFDVWVPSLRGSGTGSKWVYKLGRVGADAAGMMGKNPQDDPLGMLFGAVKVVQGIGQAQLKNASIDPKYMNWTYDDYVLKDVPTILDFVRGKTGKKKAHWVGHSMGGNILLCYLTQTPDANKKIASIFTAGSQLTMTKGTVLMRQLQNLQAQRLLEMRGDVSDLSTARQMSEDTNYKMFFNTANADSRIVEQLNAIGSDTPSMGVLGQYMTLSNSGKYSSTDNKVDYTAGAKHISAPAFFSAGAKDSFVNRDDLDFLMSNVSSQKKDSKVYGRAGGFSVDFGHNDAFISPAASQEIYPLVAEWLTSNET